MSSPLLHDLHRYEERLLTREEVPALGVTVNAHQKHLNFRRSATARPFIARKSRVKPRKARISRQLIRAGRGARSLTRRRTTPPVAVVLATFTGCPAGAGSGRVARDRVVVFVRRVQTQPAYVPLRFRAYRT